MTTVLRREVVMLFERKRRVQSRVGGDLGRRCVMEGKNVERSTPALAGGEETCAKRAGKQFLIAEKTSLYYIIYQ